MADTPPSCTPPNAIGSITTVDGQLSQFPGKLRIPTCSCTKVSNMQLFHEMKQEFATVPDHIVWQYVNNNCHNRPECILGLKKEAESHPGSVQAYPQALRNSNKKPQRPISTSLTVQSNNLSSSNESVEQPKSEVSLISDSRSDKSQSSDNNVLPKVPERPNTLNLSKLSDSYQQLSLRPTRSAPPPPTSSNQFFPQTPSIPESSESLNVSLNVTVSPVSSRPPVRPPRHTTALSVQPEIPQFNRDVQQSPRSYTSVNFTLRQPANTPQSPIDISAGPSPSLTYSSSSYDARKGYQSRLEITVAGSGSSISASRMRPRPFNVSGDNNESSYNPNATSNSVDEAELIHRQLLCKQRLSIELEKDKKRLQLIQQELRVFKAPLPTGSSQLLSEEIARLSHNCNLMIQEVEEAGPAYALGETNEAFYQNIYTGQRLPIQSARSPRPERPPPPYSLRNTNPRNDDDSASNQDGQPWTCKMCTFQNHPLLDKCEQCEMPLLTTTSSGNVQTNNRPPPMHRFQNISYRQLSAPPALHNPFQYNQTSGFIDLHPRLTQTQQN